MTDLEKLCREVRHQLTTHRYDPHYDHPINKTVSNLIDDSQNEELLFLILVNSDKPSLLASILQAMRFASAISVTEMHFSLVAHLLTNESLIIRSAAVDLLEYWGTPPALLKLKEHLAWEKTPWLVDYIRKVLHEESPKQ